MPSRSAVQPRSSDQHPRPLEERAPSTAGADASLDAAAAHATERAQLVATLSRVRQEFEVQRGARIAAEVARDRAEAARDAAETSRNQARAAADSMHEHVAF